MNSHAESLNILAPGNSLSEYLRIVHSIPVLSPQEEIEICKKMFYEHDQEAARQLALSNLRFVTFVVRSFSGYGLPEADLIQEGNLGLLKAIKRYDPKYKVRVISFATHWIKAEIYKYVINNWRIIRVVTTKAKKKLFFNRRKIKPNSIWMDECEIQEMADDLGVKPSEVREMEERMAYHDEIYDSAEPKWVNSDRFISVQPHADDELFSPELLVEQHEIKVSELNDLQLAMGKLAQRSADIVTQRRLQEPKVTLRELSEKYGISAERIRQIELAALRKIRRIIETKDMVR